MLKVSLNSTKIKVKKSHTKYCYILNFLYKGEYDLFKKILCSKLCENIIICL